MPKGTVQQLIVWCEGCNGHVSVEIRVNVPLDDAVAHIKKLKCPVCGTGPKGLKV